MNLLSHEQIIKYLKENHGVAKSINILPTFIPYLDSNANRKQFKTSLDYLVLEKLIEPGCRYEFLSWEKLNGLYPIENKVLEIQLSQKGNQYDFDTAVFEIPLPAIETHKTINDSFIAPVAETTIAEVLEAQKAEPEPEPQPVPVSKSKSIAFWKKGRKDEAPQQQIADNPKADIDVHAIKETGLSPKSMVEQKMAIVNEPDKSQPIVKPLVADKDKVKEYFKARLAEPLEDYVTQTSATTNKVQPTGENLLQPKQFVEGKDVARQHDVINEDPISSITPQATKVNDYWKARLSEPLEDSVTDGNADKKEFLPFPERKRQNNAPKLEELTKPTPALPIAPIIETKEKSAVDGSIYANEPLAEPLAFNLDTLDDIPDDIFELKAPKKNEPSLGIGGAIEPNPPAIITRTVVESHGEIVRDANQDSNKKVTEPSQADNKVRDYFKARLAEPIDGPVVENKKKDKDTNRRKNAPQLDQPIAEIKERIDEYKKDKPIEPIEDIIAEYKNAVNSFWEQEVYAIDKKQGEIKPENKDLTSHTVPATKVEDKPETRWHPFTEIKEESTEIISANPDYTGSRDRPIAPPENKWHPYVDVEDERIGVPSVKIDTTPDPDTGSKAIEKDNPSGKATLPSQNIPKVNASSKPITQSETRVYQYIEKELEPIESESEESGDFASAVSAKTEEPKIELDKTVIAKPAITKTHIEDSATASAQIIEPDSTLTQSAVPPTKPSNEDLKGVPSLVVRGFMDADEKAKQAATPKPRPIVDEPKPNPSPIVRGFMETESPAYKTQPATPQSPTKDDIKEALPIVRQFKEEDIHSDQPPIRMSYPEEIKPVSSPPVVRKFEETEHIFQAPAPEPIVRKFEETEHIFQVPTPEPIPEVLKTTPSPTVHKLEKTDKIYQAPESTQDDVKTAPSPMARKFEEAERVYQAPAPIPNPIHQEVKTVASPIIDRLEEAERVYQAPIPNPIHQEIKTASSPIVDRFEEAGRVYQAPIPNPIHQEVKTVASPIIDRLEEAERVYQAPAPTNTPPVTSQINKVDDMLSLDIDNKPFLANRQNADIYQDRIALPAEEFARKTKTLLVTEDLPIGYTPRVITPKRHVDVIDRLEQSVSIPTPVSDEIQALHRIVLQQPTAPDDAEKPNWVFKAAIVLIALMLCAAIVWYFKFRDV